MLQYTIPAFRIVAYTFDAAIHCTAHTERKFGLEPGKNWVNENAIDSEGNLVRSVFSVDQDITTVDVCDDDINEIICLVCGMTDETRQKYDHCWNCDTAWVTEIE
jgi:hypothetical protein